MRRNDIERVPISLRQCIHVVMLTAAMMLISSAALAHSPNPETTVGANVACPSKASLEALTALGSIYIGEVHGTNESPHLLQCLVDYQVASGIHPLTVSLELQPFARDTSALVWSGQDGRSSKAMAQVVDHLESLEKKGSITLNFQLPNYPIASQVDQDIGSDIRELAKTGRVIAYGGNFHAQRRQVMLPGVSIQPAGSYVGNAVKNVSLNSTATGTAWVCTTSCGVHPAKSFIATGKAGALVDGKEFGYDYLYFVPQYTASAPKFPPVVRKGL